MVQPRGFYAERHGHRKGLFYCSQASSIRMRRSPVRSSLRSQLVFDDKANTTAVDFSDIASHWAKDEISAAANNGWINGYTDGTFRPNNKITRAEAMTLVNRVLKRLPETAEDLHNDMIKGSDNSDTSAWYYLAVQEATNSHYYDIKENKHEKWSKLRETRDWTELKSKYFPAGERIPGHWPGILLH